VKGKGNGRAGIYLRYSKREAIKDKTGKEKKMLSKKNPRLFISEDRPVQKGSFAGRKTSGKMEEERTRCSNLKKNNT